MRGLERVAGWSRRAGVRLPAILGGALLLSLAACGGSTSAPAAPPWHLLTVSIPPSVVGFDVQPEKASASSLERAGGVHSLIDAAAVFSFRQTKELHAVLEITEFKPGTNSADPGFQQDVVGQVGQRVPREVKVHGRVVYEGAASNEQSIYSWFTGRRMVILLVRGVKNPEVLLDALLARL